MPNDEVGRVSLGAYLNSKPLEQQAYGLQRLAGNIGKKLGVALAAGLSVKALATFSKKCLELGSDLAEVQNVVDVTFPHMTAQIDKFAKNAAQKFGLSETMAKQYTGTFGSMAEAFGFTEKQALDMSETLTGLAGDVASFYNISQDEAYTKLKSVFSGETETLKDLGIVMTQSALDAYALANGFGKTTSAMTEMEKVSLRYAFVQSQLTNATGDFARTSDSWANQMRLLSLQMQSIMATIGQGLINLFTPVVRVINVVLGKITTLANAFKAFTELITGNASSGSSSVASPVTELASAAGDAASGLNDASTAAGNTGKAAKKAGESAKKAAKEMRSLMGFDVINKVSDNSSDSNSGSGSSGGIGGSGGTGNLGTAVDYGQLASGETAIDKFDSKFQRLIDRCKELSAIFKAGFSIGFGDSEKKIQSINKHIDSIGKTLKGIFTDAEIVRAANGLFDAIALNAGKVAGSMASIGLSIADNLLGGIDGYLQQSAEYIKKRLIAIFDVGADSFNIVGDFSVALSRIFDVLDGEYAKKCTSELIGIFADGFLGVADLATSLGRDIIDLILTPITKNADKLRDALDNTLAPISRALKTLHQGVTDTVEKICAVYDEHIRPLVESVRDGISQIVSDVLGVYNQHFVPVLDKLADKFDKTWKQHIQPMLDNIIELVGTVADALKSLWENILQPLIEWIVKNILPVLAPILEKVGSFTLDLIGGIADAISGITKVLQGVIDFLTAIFSLVVKFFSDVFGGAVKGIKKVFEGIGSWFGKRYEDITSAFNNIGSWFTDKFQAAWDGITGVFGNIGSWFKSKFDALKSLKPPKLSAIVTLARDKWKNVTDWIKKKHFGKKVAKAIDLAKDKWANVADWLKKKHFGKKVAKKIELAKDGWTSVAAWVKDRAGRVVNKAIELKKGNWSSVAAWIGDRMGGIVRKAIGLQKGNWTSVASWLGDRMGGLVRKTIGLKKGNWSSVAAWVKNRLGGVVRKAIDLAKNGWTSVAAWVRERIGGAVNVGVNLVKDWIGSFRDWVVGNADGGIYANGRWSPVQQYASGGIPNQGQLFVAREAGPELVGTLGGHTAVMNNNQIVASVSAGVAQAMAQVMQDFASAIYRAIACLEFYVPNPQTPIVNVAAPALKGAVASAQETPDLREVLNLLRVIAARDNAETVAILRQILEMLCSLELVADVDVNALKKLIVRLINEHTRATGICEIEI